MQNSKLPALFILTVLAFLLLLLNIFDFEKKTVRFAIKLFFFFSFYNIQEVN